MGASVYDRTHGSCRGYGIIMSAAKPVNGIPKWYVDFQGGDRNTAIQAGGKIPPQRR